MEYNIDHLILHDAADLDVQFDVDINNERTLNNDRLRNSGKYVQVITVEYNGTMCAAKQLIKNPENFLLDLRMKYFRRECLMHSKLDHPNVVKMLGVCHNGSGESSGLGKIPWPVLVMELVEYNLSDYQLSATPMYVKLSILQDISIVDSDTSILFVVPQLFTVILASSLSY